MATLIPEINNNDIGKGGNEIQAAGNFAQLKSALGTLLKGIRRLKRRQLRILSEVRRNTADILAIKNRP